MARYAQVLETAGVVVNVIEWDGNTATWQPPAGYTMISDPDMMSAPGFSWDGTSFTPPPGGEPGTGEPPA